jgi:hypothetical protein
MNSLYQQRLATLKRDIVALENIKKKKRWKPNQKVMIDYINKLTKSAVFIINGITVTLRDGDSNKGFIHILEKHYCEACPGKITTMEILNMYEIFERGIKLSNVGVTNDELIVYHKIKNGREHKLVLKSVADGNLIVTMYSIG